MKPVHRNRRLILIGVGALLLGGAAFLVAKALDQNLAYFYTPAEAAAAEISPQTRIRLGGLVETGTVTYAEDASVSFMVTDGAASMKVTYKGVLPDLFREGQGVVAQGRFDENGAFLADTILAKHDENYVPRELEGVMEKAKDAGHPG